MSAGSVIDTPKGHEKPRIGILVVAYNAAGTLHQVLDRIPAGFRSRIDQVLVSDDASHDATYLVGLGWQQTNQDVPLTVIRQDRNLGYGGNQKAGYRWAIEHGLDIVVLLHGDGQYAPELLPDMVAPLVAGEADAVFGSRMVEPGRARRGGMPLYKYLGNRILTTFENMVVGTDLSEWHSGYRAYSVEALGAIPFDRNSDGFDFDTQVIVQLIEAGRCITEIPIPTYYGDEISHVNGLKYAWDICGEVVRYRLHKMGFGSGELAFASEIYEEKTSDDSSHGLVTRRVAELGGSTPGHLLDLGCSDGALAARFRASGWTVTGVDLERTPEVEARVDRFVEADLDEGLPDGVLADGAAHQVVLAADVLEHVRDPERLLRQLHEVVASDGVVLASIPNVAHWYVRARVLLGRWDYDRRGILDRTHLRFFTRRSFTRAAERSGWRVTRVVPTGLPLDIVDRGGEGQASGARRVVSVIDRTGVAIAPTLFGYQFLFELEPAG